jgi:hypothetical protein
MMQCHDAASRHRSRHSVMMQCHDATPRRSVKTQYHDAHQDAASRHSVITLRHDEASKVENAIIFFLKGFRKQISGFRVNTQNFSKFFQEKKLWCFQLLILLRHGAEYVWTPLCIFKNSYQIRMLLIQNALNQYHIVYKKLKIR